MAHDNAGCFVDQVSGRIDVISRHAIETDRFVVMSIRDMLAEIVENWVSHGLLPSLAPKSAFKHTRN